jgi:hypothetical protein
MISKSTHMHLGQNSQSHVRPPSVHQKACLVIESQFDWIVFEKLSGPLVGLIMMNY